MFLDAHKIPPGTQLSTDICIVGAGAAGITLARELAENGGEITVLEAGGLKLESLSQSLYEGENVGIPYELETTRSRFFGGSTNCWGGFCSPMDPFLMAKRDWIPHSGWPISASELLPYYRRACTAAGIPYADGFDVGAWEKTLSEPCLTALPIDSEKLLSDVAQVAHVRRRFGKFYRKELSSSANVRVILHANVGLIDIDSNGRTVRRVKVIPEAGKEFWVSAKTFVLATGGIENARILLLSDNVHRNGLGNGNDIVGRFFMENATIPAASLELSDKVRSTRIYDTAYAYNKLPTSFFLHLSNEVQARERLTHAACFIDNWTRGEEAVSVESLKYCYMEIKKGIVPKHLPTHIINMAKSAPGLLQFVCWYLFGWDRLIARRDLIISLEPSPNPDSRVLLSSDTDRLGLKKARLDWRLTDLDRHSMQRTLQIVTEELSASGVGSLKPYEHALDGEWMKRPNWVWHHMGTTRMGTNPKDSVVGTDLRVHGLDNLYLTGSSVFPCAPVHVPTLTIIALAIRLADHLKHIDHALPEIVASS